MHCAGSLRVEDWRAVRTPTLVLSGEKSEPVLRKGAEAIAEALPNAELRILVGQGHNPSMAVLAKALK